MGQRFAQNLIDAYMAGQNVRANRLSMKRQERLEAEAMEDRDIEKQLLQHRVKTMNLEDKLQERKAAKENLDMLSGLPASEFQNATDQDVNSLYEHNPIPGQVGESGMVPVRKPTITIPGIPGDLLGGTDIPSVNVKPRTLEEQIADQMVAIRQRALMTPHELSYGEVLYDPLSRSVLGQGQDRPPTSGGGLGGRILNERDAQGNVTPHFYTNAQIQGGADLPKQAPLPKTGPGGSASMLTDEQRDPLIEAFINGADTVENIPNTTEGLRIRSGLAKRGFNVARASAETRAMRARIGALNAEQVVQLQMDAAAAKEALTELDRLNVEFKSKGYGALSLYSPFNTDEDEANRKRMQDLIGEVKPLLVRLRSTGNNPSNAQLDEMAAKLDPGKTQTDLSNTIQALRDFIGYRLNGIMAAQVPLLPQGVGAPNTGAPGTKPQGFVQDANGKWVLPEKK